ncbi:MAG: aminotransferase class V-fold PLP-dependent enzyme [Balneolaceae bacterium]
MNLVFTDAELNDIRADFPHAEQGHIYLNHAAVGPISKRVRNALDQFLLERHLSPIENMEKGMKTVEETRQSIAELIHAPSAGTITFTGNTSDGLSAVAEGYNWQPGDQVLLNTMEFPANIQPFRILERKGVEIVYAEPQNGMISPEVIEAAITSKTKMVSVSAVQYLNGFMADLHSIGKLCRQQNIRFIVDGIQALGAAQIDVQSAQIDALASGGHKWMMGPLGLGFLYLSEEFSRELTPYKTGWLSVEEPWELTNYHQKWQPVSQHLETGTPNMLGITGLGASLKRFLELGPERVSHRVKQLSNHIIRILSENSSGRIITPQNEEMRAGIITFSAPVKSTPEDTVQQLKEKNITISAREGYFRFSPHYYNTSKEIDRALQALL